MSENGELKIFTGDPDLQEYEKRLQRILDELRGKLLPYEEEFGMRIDRIEIEHTAFEEINIVAHGVKKVVFRGISDAHIKAGES